MAVTAPAGDIARVRPRAINRTAVIVGGLTVVAFVLRLSQLHQSLYGDEVLALHDIAGHSLRGTIQAVRSGVESSPPLYFVLAWLSAKLGDPTVWIRLPSLILGTATVPLVYSLGRETRRGDVGLLAAAILATSPFAIYYGVEARPYASVGCFVALSTLAVVRAVRTGHRGWWAVYALAAAAAAYTYYTAVFLLAVQGAWSLWAGRRQWRRPVLANLLIALLYLPWLPKVHGSLLGVYGLLEPLTLGHVLRDLAQAIAGYPYASLTAIPTIPGLVLFVACALPGVAVLLIRAQRRHLTGLLDRLRRADVPVLIGLLAIATPLGLLVDSLIGTDIWGTRNLYASVPAAAIVFAGLVLGAPVAVRPVGVALSLLVLVFGTVRASHRDTPSRRSEAAEWIDRTANPRDPVIMYPSALNLDQAIPAQCASAPRSVGGPDAVAARGVRQRGLPRLRRGSSADVAYPGNASTELHAHGPPALPRPAVVHRPALRSGVIVSQGGGARSRAGRAYTRDPMDLPFGLNPYASDPGAWGASLVNNAEILLGVLDAAEARSVIEVGAYAGDLTRLLLLWAQGREAQIMAVDPSPQPALEELEREFSELVLVRETSIDAFDHIDLADAIIIDGDHNYYTVTEELRRIDARANGELPLLLLHDVSWPHGRRDDYFDPEQIPAEFRQPIAPESGVYPGVDGVKYGGLPYHFPAAREGGPRNGVLTAVEDFVAGRDELRLAVVSSFFGLGLVFPRSAPYAEALERILAPYDNNPWLARLERNRVLHLASSQVQLRLALDAQEQAQRQQQLLERMLHSRAFAAAEMFLRLRQRGRPAFSRAQIRRVIAGG